MDGYWYKAKVPEAVEGNGFFEQFMNGVFTFRFAIIAFS